MPHPVNVFIRIPEHIEDRSVRHKTTQGFLQRHSTRRHGLCLEAFEHGLPFGGDFQRFIARERCVYLSSYLGQACPQLLDKRGRIAGRPTSWQYSAICGSHMAQGSNCAR